MRTTGRVFFISVPPIQPLGTAWQEQPFAGDICVGSPPTSPSYTRAALRANAPPNTLLPTHYVRLFGAGSTAGAALKTTALGTKSTRKSPNSSSRILE